MSGVNQIGSQHRERLAVVYVRQSTLAQVRENTESTARQYALVEEAARLGWDSSRIIVLDGDLGLSGRSASLRPGFKELVSRVCLGEVGAVFGLEVSRLARSSADFQRLIEFCSLTDTLIVDADGVYDLRDFNDRLLLGLKGTMSEAELHILAGRLQESKRAAAKRGELRFPLPVGYIYDEDGRVVMDPDEEIRSAVTDVFAAFAATGSAYGTVGLFKDRRFPLRAYGGVWAGEIRWGRLTHSRTLALLSNPSYAGTYVFGRFRSRRWIDSEGVIRLRTTKLPREEWAVVIQDHHAAYITWSTFLDIQGKLVANCTRAGARPPREGSALLQGLVLCGSCGRAMSTRYDGLKRADYECAHRRADHAQLPGCRSITAAAVDGAVSRRVLEVVTPDQIALALAAADQVTERRARASRALELQVERARYESMRAERAFHLCEPENRLVARSLEQRWEAKLAALAEAEAAVVRATEAIAPLPPRAELEALARDLPRLWSAPTTSAKDRKRLLRKLIADVTLLSEPVGEEVRIGIHWRSGGMEEIAVRRRRGRCTPRKAVELVGQLAECSDQEVAEELNAQELATGAGKHFDARAVQWVRYAHGIPLPPHSPFAEGELSVKEVAARLRVSDGAVYYWIEHGKLHARQTDTGRLCIPFPPEVEQACREMVADSVRINTQTKMASAGGAV